MPLYDYECKCGKVTERLIPVSKYQDAISCPWCGETARRVFAAGKHYCGNQDSGWIKSVLEVVDKDDKSPVTTAFLRNPTRSNYKAWMKAQGIRPIEDGEKRVKYERIHITTDQLMRRLQERRRVEI